MAPEGSILRTEDVMSLLERIKKFNDEWVRPSIYTRTNRNNVSATVSMRETDWKHVGEWMWENKAS